MSCYNGCQCGCNTGCVSNTPYCAPILPQQESVASQLENLSTKLFGPFTRTIQNGRGIWTGLCSITSAIPGFARSDNEGFICYILRYLTTNPNAMTGIGPPEGVVTASPGALYVNTNGGANATLYVKESGVATNTGWAAK